MAPESKSKKRKTGTSGLHSDPKRLKSAVQAQDGPTTAISRQGRRTKDAKAASLKSAHQETSENLTTKISTSEGSPASNPEDDEIALRSGEDEDDQTAQLLKGFESSSEEDVAEPESLAVQEVPSIPNDKSLQKQLQNATKDEENTPGVIYVGRIPHGFYEHQMRAYFSQFGDILRLRLSRNRKTGHSKHYAFIEFASAAVAQIVAQAMDKYLMFGHILQVRTIPADQVHPNLFKGANRRFKPAPRNRMEARRLREGMGREAWEKRIGGEESRRRRKAAKMKELGYEYEAPALKSVKDVPVKMVDAGSTAADGVPEALAEAPVAQIVEAREVTVRSEPSTVIVTEKLIVRQPELPADMDAMETK